MRLPLLCLAMALSGAAALTHQMLWVRMLGHLFGRTVLAVHVVLFVFFAGTGLGAWWVGRVADRHAPGVRLFCVLELVLAGCALGFAPALSSLETLYLSWDPAGWTPARGLLARAGLSAVLLLVPTVAMGGTLPAMTRAAHAAGRHVSRRLGWLYGLNTIGAAAGALAAVFVLVPRVGLRTGLVVAAGLNLVSAAVAWSARARAAEHPGPAPAPARPVPHAATTPPDRATRAPRPVLLLAAGLAGLVSIGAEVLWTRALAARFGGTVFAYALILAAFLLALGVGPTLTGLLDRLGLVGRRACALVFTGAGLGVIASVGTIATLGRSGPEAGLVTELGAALSVMGAPALLFGLNLPVLLAALHRDPGHVGRDVGTLWLANTVGAVLAPVLVGLFAVPALGLDTTLLLLGGAAVLFGATVLVPWAFAAPWPVMGLITGAAAGLVLLAPHPDARWHLAEDETLLVAGDGVSASLAVVETAAGERILKLDGHYKLGGTRTRFAQDRQGLLPLLMHPDPRSCLMLGVGSGGSAGAAAAWGRLALDALEIVPEVPALLPWFERANHGLLARVREDPEVRLLLADARHFVRTTERRYDVVVGDLFVPWNASEAGMYTLEHLRAVRATLADGGILVQWLPLYQLRSAELRTIVATFLRVFASVEAVWLYFNVEQPAIGLVAGEAPLAWTRETLQPRLEDPARRALLAGADLVEALPVLASRLAGRRALAAWAEDAPLETRDRPRIEYGSAALARRDRRDRPIDAILDALLALPAPPAGDPEVAAYRRALHLALDALRTPGRRARLERLAQAFVQAPEWVWLRRLVEGELLGALAARELGVLDEALAALRHRPRTRHVADHVAARAALELDGDRARALELARASLDARPGYEPAARLVARLERELAEDR